MTAFRAVIDVACEGALDEVVARVLVGAVGADVGRVYVRGGRPALLKRLPAYNNAARRSPWLVLVDLDRDPACAPEALRRWLPRPAAGMCLRIAVRQVEAWLMGDRERIAEFLAVPVARVPADPESLDDPKRKLVDLARQSRRRAIRKEMVAPPGSGRTVGPGYNDRMTEYVEERWRPEVAARCCGSLSRALACVGRLAQAARRG